MPINLLVLRQVLNTHHQATAANMDWLKFMMGFIGHLGIWCVLFNRIHATAWPRSTRKTSEKMIILAVAIPFVWIAAILILKRSLTLEALTFHPTTFFYFYICVLAGIFFTCRWIYRKSTMRLPKAVVSTKRIWLDLKSELDVPLTHGRVPNILARIPFNEATKLTLQEMTLELDVLETLHGLKICQISDLHFTGHIGIEYFQRIVEEANRFGPDLVVITGDIIDESHCLDWFEETLGRLNSKLGVYYVLGNHDRRMKDEIGLRDRLSRCGLIQASGQWSEVVFNGATIQLTGNELPWYRDVDSLNESPAEADLRILLSHSPDQIDWARGRGFELMFAGHTHGGQIAIPFIGPLVAPSKYGVLYASGTFQVDDILMHVSRGISGDESIRICSPPELGLFTIHSNRTKQS